MGQQLSPQRTARVRAGEILFAESACIQQRNGQRIPERELRRRAGRGGQVERAGLLLDPVGQHHIGVRREARLRPAGHRHQRDPQAAQGGQDGRQFGALTGIGDRQHHIARGHHPEVTVAGLAGVNEERRGAGRCQRGGDLAADVATLAHAHHHHPAAAGQHRPQRVGKGCPQLALQAEQGLRLDAQGLAGHVDGALGIKF